jgi:hypothetical protein
MTTRRNFIKFFLAFCGSLIPWLFNGCKKVAEPNQKSPDILFEGDEAAIASTVRQQFPNLLELTQTPGKELSIGFYSESGLEILNLSFQKDRAADYQHVRITGEGDGKRVHLLWGEKNLLPTLRLTDDVGNTLAVEGKKLEFGLFDVATLGRTKTLSTTQFTAEDLISLGIKVTAVALAIWLGASVSKFIIGAIAFLAFNAMVLGLLAVAIGVVTPLIKWVLEKTDIKSVADVRNFFGKALHDIVQILQDSVELIQRQLTTA